MSCESNYPLRNQIISSLPGEPVLAEPNVTYVLALGDIAGVVHIMLPGPFDQSGSLVTVVNASGTALIANVTHGATGSPHAIRFLVHYNGSATFYAAGPRGWISPHNRRGGFKNASIQSVGLINNLPVVSFGALLKIINVSKPGQEAVIKTPTPQQYGCCHTDSTPWLLGGPFEYTGTFDPPTPWEYNPVDPANGDAINLVFQNSAYPSFQYTLNCRAISVSMDPTNSFYTNLSFQTILNATSAATTGNIPGTNPTPSQAGVGIVTNNSGVSGQLIEIQYDPSDPTTKFGLNMISINGSPSTLPVVEANGVTTIFGSPWGTTDFKGFTQFYTILPNQPYPNLPPAGETFLGTFLSYPIIVFLQDVISNNITQLNATMTSMAPNTISSPIYEPGFYQQYGCQCLSMEITIPAQ